VSPHQSDPTGAIPLPNSLSVAELTFGNVLITYFERYGGDFDRAVAAPVLESEAGAGVQSRP
jgi:hypothetical protein